MAPEQTNDNETKARISELIGTMASLFPSAEVGAKTNRAYVAMLQDVPLVVLTAAVDQCCAECKFLPTVAEIREKANMLTQPSAPPALQAWKTVIEAIKRYGWNKSVTALKEIEAENPIAAEAARCLGWQELCNSENQIADRAHFSKVYDQLATRQQIDARLLPSARDIKLISGVPIFAQLTRGKKQ